VILGDDAPLVATLIWSAPIEQLDGYSLLGGPDLARLAGLPGCRGYCQVDLSDRLAVTTALHRLMGQREASPVLAMAADDPGCAALADLSVPGLIIAPVSDRETLARLSDKWAFHGLCQSLGLPTPATRWFAAKADIDAQQCLVDHDGAIIVKPTNRHGGLGVTLIRSVADFERQVLGDAAFNHAPLLVQAFIPGADLDISVLANKGQVLHRAIQAREGRRLRFLDHAELAAAVEALMKHTGFSGLAHIDARVREDGSVVLIECNTRPWATLSKATWCGLNFIRATVDTARGRASREPAVLNVGIALAPDAWVLTALARPWRFLALNRDQRRILQGAILAFVTLDWRKRWSRVSALFGTGGAR